MRSAELQQRSYISLRLNLAPARLPSPPVPQPAGSTELGALSDHRQLGAEPSIWCRPGRAPPALRGSSGFHCCSGSRHSSPSPSTTPTTRPTAMGAIVHRARSRLKPSAPAPAPARGRWQCRRRVPDLDQDVHCAGCGGGWKGGSSLGKIDATVLAAF